MATSKLKSSANDTKRIGILAGSGRLPPLLAEAILLNGHIPFIVNLNDQPLDWQSPYEHVNISVTNLSKLVRALREAQVSTVVFAGGISQRPKLWDFLADWRMYREFWRIYRALKRGDDGLLRAAINLIERFGFTVVGAHEIAPSLLAPEAILTIKQPTPTDLIDTRAAIKAAIELGRLDIGQAVVARAGKIIAREDRRGTAVMLVNLANDAHLARSGVLVKWSKPNQELRVDLPSIGPDTIDQIRAAGLAGIVVESGRSLILDQDEVVRLANANHLFVVGMRSELC
jgi:UDP-2,3-diacylglucosamine hydrolase